MQKTQEESNRVKALEDKLQQVIQENRALQQLASSSGNEKVMVRHSGYGPSIVVPVGDDKNYVLSNQPGQTFVHLPLDIYLEMKNSTPFFQEGYLYTEDDLDNPNLILDVDEWVSSRTERKIVSGVQEITSPGTLEMLYDYTEDREEGKYLALKSAVSKRINELLEVDWRKDQD